MTYSVFGSPLVLEVMNSGPQGPAGPSGMETPAIQLTDASVVSIDISTGSIFEVTLGGDRTINFTGGTSALNGKKIMLRILQDGTGSRLVTWGGEVGFGTDIPDVELTTTPGKRDVLGLIYDHAATSYDMVAIVKGY